MSKLRVNCLEIIRQHQNSKWIFSTKLAKKGLKLNKRTSPANLYIRNSLGIRFQLKLEILNFWTKLTQEGYFRSKKEKNENHHPSSTIEFQISASTNNFDFSKQFSKTRILPNQKWKNEHHHWILHIHISLGIKLYFDQTILNFGTKFAQNSYLRSKTIKINITIEFCIFELV